MVALGLDISTSCTGYSILDSNKMLLDQGFISLSKQKCAYEKADICKNKIRSLIQKYNIEKIFIEQNLQSFRSGFSSAQTLSTLARFNGIISYICYDISGIKPIFVNVNSARKTVGIKIISKKNGGKPTKDQVFEWVKTDLKNKSIKFVWPEKTLKSGPRKGQTVFLNECYDIADAYIICQAGLKI